MTSKYDELRDLLATQSLEMADDEIDEEVRSAGDDPKQVVQKMRSSIEALIQKTGKARMAAARQERLREVVVPRKFDQMPIEKVRQMVNRAMQKPEAGRLSQAAREGSHESDQDFRSKAEQLAELGLLDDEDE